MYYVIRQKSRHPKHLNKKDPYWSDVSYYDENNNFKGASVFNSKKAANAYLKRYTAKMQNNGRVQNLEIRIFEVDNDKLESLPVFVPFNFKNKNWKKQFS